MLKMDNLSESIFGYRIEISFFVVASYSALECDEFAIEIIHVTSPFALAKHLRFIFPIERM
jgi:hypothetical protein